MYAPFFGLSKEPFSIAPDPRFLYMSGQHREALAHLLYGLGGGGGFVLLTGEIGAGKTTVFRCFLEQVPAQCAVAYVFNPKLTVAELLQTIGHEFGVQPPADASSVKAHVDALNAFLLEAHAQGRQAVLVIDEAQALSADVLEQLRLLTNLETAERKLLQIVLIGQPELRDMLARPELEQLAQRVIARYHLGPLSFAETQQYIRHRLAVAGPSAPLPFSKTALTRIHALSGGVPRRINLLADRALLGAYGQGLQRAERKTVDQAAREVFGRGLGREGGGRLPWWPWALAGVAGVAALVLLGVWVLQQQGLLGAGMAGAGPAASGVVAGVGASAASAAAGASGAVAVGVAGAGAAASAAARGDALAAARTGASAPADPVLSEPADVLANAHVQQATAWRELALRWNVAIGEGDACVAVLQAQLACFRSPKDGGLALLRHVGRPAVLTLRPASGPVVYAVLVALDDRYATLQSGSRRFVLTLPVLASVWRGEFATLWRTPPGWREGQDAIVDPEGRAWVDARLSEAGFPSGRPLFERVWGYQLSQGLPTDGLAGPVTLMRLGRGAAATGTGTAAGAAITEPRLTAADR